MDVARLLRKLKAVKVFTVTELAGWLSCSIPTARRRLNDWRTHTSYNCNGRYYTLPDVPVFDRNGLWRCRGAFFSRHGNLRQTVSALVAASPAGLTAGELGEMLGLEGRSFLSHFRDDPGLYRERRGRRHVWFSGNRAARERQRQARERMTERSVLLSDAEAVPLLVELVRNPRIPLDELAEILRPRVPRISPGLIDQFLHFHNLEGKKGASQ